MVGSYLPAPHRAPMHATPIQGNPRRRFRPRWLVALLLTAALAWPAAALGQVYAPMPIQPAIEGDDDQSAAAAQGLINAQYQNKRDALGFFWMTDQQGSLRANGPAGYRAAEVLQINGSNFSADNAQMTPDGSEYVFTGSQQNLQIMRRLKFDMKAGTARYVETFLNANSAPLAVKVQLIHALQARSTVLASPSGTSLVNAASTPGYRSSSSAAYRFIGNLPAKDYGMAALASNGIGVLLYVPPSRSGPKPNVQIERGQNCIITYDFNIPPQQAISLLHGFAQRTLPAAADPKELAKQFRPFRARQWTGGLPAEVVKTIFNFGRLLGQDAPAGPLLEPVLELAARYHVERGAADVLVQDEQSQLAGTASGGELSVQTRFGKATVPLAEAALLVGGAGVDRPMRIYLRNGEVLAGTVQAKELILKSQAGVEAKIQPGQINLLFFRAGPTDGKPAAEAAVLVQTHLGERLVLGAKSVAKIQAATPWGPLEVGIEEIDRLYGRREPQPICRLLLKDGTRLPAILQGEDLALGTLRFGAVKISPASVEQIRTLATATATDEDDDAQQIKIPHCRLAGEAVMIGQVDVPKIEVQTITGVVSVETARVRTMERREEAQPPLTFEFDLGAGNRVTGPLTDRTLPIRFHGKVWNVPLQHVVAYNQPRDEPEAPAATAKDTAKPAAKPRGKPKVATGSLELPDDLFGQPPTLPPSGTPGYSVPSSGGAHAPPGGNAPGPFDPPPPPAPPPPRTPRPAPQPVAPEDANPFS